MRPRPACPARLLVGTSLLNLVYACWVCACSAAKPTAQQPPVHVELPVVPVGFDAYRNWADLPRLRLGVRAYMRSTYDRTGGNEGADASHFLRQDARGFAVPLDISGPGVLYFVRTNHWHGSPWHYIVDAVDHDVEESSTSTPNAPPAVSTFLPEGAFPSPLALTWSTTMGADLNWVPIPFEKTFTLGYGRTHYGTGYYIYHLFPEGADNLSQPINAWNEEPPPTDVVQLLASAGTDIAPAAETARVTEATLDVADGATALVAELTDGPGMIRALRLTAPADQALALSRARLQITWDDRAQPSVDAPLALFFGAGSLYRRTDAEWLVKALLMNIRFSSTEVALSAYFPMPYFRRATIKLVAAAGPLTGMKIHVRNVPYTGPPNHVGYFHATYRDHANPAAGRDLVILDTHQTEAGGDWCGHFAGMTWIFSDKADLGTLEGDPRFFFDDSQSPQGYGTGTEEWGGGGDYWGGRTVTLPLAGHPVGAPSPDAVQDPEDAIESAYRILLADLMPFGRNARIQLEHGGTNDSTQHYQSVAYWYGTPHACLVPSDRFDVGNHADELVHAYVSPEASPVETFSSRYEWGVDHVGAVEVFPETSEDGRHTTGTTELTLAVDPHNAGVLLRRKVDYAIPNQAAEVYVADADGVVDFVRAGIWYLAGSNTCVYSNPPGELDPLAPTVQTSNRRFREDEFLLPRALTEGRDRLRLRFTHIARDLPLLGGQAAQPSAFSELYYWAYSYVLPAAP